MGPKANAQHCLFLKPIDSWSPHAHLMNAESLVFGLTVVIDNPFLIRRNLRQSASVEFSQQLEAVANSPIFLILRQFMRNGLPLLVSFSEFVKISINSCMGIVKLNG